MKGSSATSASPNAKGTPDAGQPSPSSPTRADGLSGRHDPPLGGYPLSGPSNLPDPRTHAYRQDLADAALAGRVIASHYAEPLERTLAADTDLLAEPDADAEVLARLSAGTTLHMLDNSRGWAWGYAGDNRLVGYVRGEAVGGR